MTFLGLDSQQYKTISGIALPIALQSAILAVLSMADVLMVHDLGPAAIASVGAAVKWHFVAIMIMAGFGSACGSLVAQYWGKGQRSKAAWINWYAVRSGAWVMLPLTAMVFIFAEQMLSVQSTDAQVIAYGSSYLIYSLPLLLLTHVIIAIESSLRSSGQTLLPMALVTFTVVVNIVLNYVLIPIYGVKGAAIATTLARVMHLCAFLLVLYKTKSWLFEVYQEKISPQLKGDFKALVLPSVAASLVWGLGTLVYQIVIGRMGTQELAVFSLLGPFESLCYSIFFGLAAACSVLVGQSLGRNDFAKARLFARFFIVSIPSICVVLGVALWLAREPVLALLHLDGAELLPVALPTFAIFCAVMWMRMGNMVMVMGILRAGGQVNFCLRGDIIGMWLIAVPLVFYGAFIGKWDFQWVYLALWTEEICKFGIFFYGYRRGLWLRNLTRDDEELESLVSTA
ncbi:MATE family efflux transporter [Alginatibacterium sediminis]|uniref:Multidrug-efflux transporter n=1 Tax=Alginatibacterium sediminis TaxID=2164068 RepID=A0A420E5U5_9ALTE|nr:MATE family efflux transporter [Alginatibacterium sediminis]RKF13219.1 MATE family efflux transporter [Alginatibacterium sediminis]